MSFAVYYNEIDPYAAEWLRHLICAGHIAPGVVDTRSIEDVTPSDLKGFAQCHFFAGIGVWSYALRRAGWADRRNVWTGSCPCQPFSAAGKGAGFADERHLWPAWHHLIEVARPSIVLGEQVASKDAMPWIDLVQDDMEALDYAFAAVPFPAASVGAPHIRDRLYWMVDAHGEPWRLSEHARWTNGPEAQWSRAARELAHRSSARLEVIGEQLARCELEAPERSGAARIVGDTPYCRQTQRPTPRSQPDDQRHGPDNAGILGGFWADAEWIWCRDEKWRPVEPGSFPLAHGAPARVGRLRAYGNAINAEAAVTFIQATGLV